MLGRLRRLVPLGAVAGATGAADKARVPEEAAVPVTVLVFCARLAARVRGRVRRRRRRRGQEAIVVMFVPESSTLGERFRRARLKRRSRASGVSVFVRCDRYEWMSEA